MKLVLDKTDLRPQYLTAEGNSTLPLDSIEFDAFQAKVRTMIGLFGEATYFADGLLDWKLIRAPNPQPFTEPGKETTRTS